jgi:recombinational DNA repair ATPase RecF
VRKVTIASVWKEGEARNSTEKNIILRRKQDDTAKVFGAWNESVTTHGVELPQGWRSEEQNQIEQEGEDRKNAPTKGRKDKGSAVQTHWRENEMTTLPA